MEYMKIEGFLGAAISKFVNKAMSKKFGFDPGLSLSHLNFRTATLRKEDDTVEVQLTASMSREAFQQLIEEATR